MKIQKIEIKDHPLFEDVELKLKNTNFLIGDNRVGKTLFMAHFIDDSLIFSDDEYRVLEKSFKLATIYLWINYFLLFKTGDIKAPPIAVSTASNIFSVVFIVVSSIFITFKRYNK